MSLLEFVNMPWFAIRPGSQVLAFWCGGEQGMVVNRVRKLPQFWPALFMFNIIIDHYHLSLIKILKKLPHVSSSLNCPIWGWQVLVLLIHIHISSKANCWFISQLLSLCFRKIWNGHLKPTCLNNPQYYWYVQQWSHNLHRSRICLSLLRQRCFLVWQYTLWLCYSLHTLCIKAPWVSYLKLFYPPD